MNKKLLAIVGGAGVATGLLLAPDKGSRTIRKITGKGKKILDNVKRSATNEINSTRTSLRDKVEEVKQKIRERARAAADATLDAEEKVHRKLRSAIRSAAKAAGPGAQKKTSGRMKRTTIASRNGVVKRKSVGNSKPSRLKRSVAAKRAAKNGTARKSSTHKMNGKSRVRTTR